MTRARRVGAEFSPTSHFVAVGIGTLLSGWLGLARAAAPAEQRAVTVSVRPHDREAFTQGLLLYDGYFYESTGLRGQSTLRRVDVDSGGVLDSVSLSGSEFGEGLARVDDRLIQLTWQSGVAHVYDIETFEELRTFAYEGEGWGLCFDGERLVMSNGSSRLTFRDPDTFEVLSGVDVTLDGSALRNLNELECVDDLVYANVWLTDKIVAIDPSSGEVVSDIDASGLLSDAQAAEADVLNGIAFDAATGRFHVTGKLWPSVFEVDFVAEGGAGAGGTPGSGGASTSADSGVTEGEDSAAEGGCSLGDTRGKAPGGQGWPIVVLGAWLVLRRRGAWGRHYWNDARTSGRRSPGRSLRGMSTSADGAASSGR